jgi:energy-coupling factor transporter ATP-binding protein EcfA2
MLLAEQNTNIALRVSDRGYVLEMGKIVMSGASKELSGNGAVWKSVSRRLLMRIPQIKGGRKNGIGSHIYMYRQKRARSGYFG